MTTVDEQNTGFLPNGFRWFFYPTVLLICFCVRLQLAPTPVGPIAPAKTAPAGTNTNNVIIGYNAGTATTGTDNVFIGYGTTPIKGEKE